MLNLKSYLKFIKYRRKIKQSGLFDRRYYLEKNPDILAAGINPVKHFLLYGGFEGRNPGPGFNSAFYLVHYPDVKASGMNPLVHYLLYGHKEGRFIQPEKFSSQPLGPMEPHPDFNLYGKNESALPGLGISSNDLHLISQSGLFDPEYYLVTNPDVKDAGINPLEHYFFHGWKEGRNPSEAFETHFYMTTHEDVKISGLNPLIHYIRIGNKQGHLAKSFEINEDECLAKAGIKDLAETQSGHVDLKIAIVCHLFYPDLADEFIGYLKNCPFPFDLYITTTHDKEDSVRSQFAANLPEVKATVLAVENRGRDIGPLIALLKTHLMKYDLVCKVHSKKSGHNLNLQGWRKFLLDQLLGNPMIVNRIITEFVHNKQLGLIWPVAYPYLSYLGLEKGWGPPLSREKNFHAASIYFSDLHLEEFGQDFVFPLGSMFWFRPLALALIGEKNIGINHFEDEEKQVDGTLAHAFERLFGIIALRAGFETKTVFFSKKKT